MSQQGRGILRREKTSREADSVPLRTVVTVKRQKNYHRITGLGLLCVGELIQEVIEEWKPGILFNGNYK